MGLLIQFSLFFLFVSGAWGQDIQCVLNKKALGTVSDKFVSVSLDPSILSSGFNISDSFAKLAKFVSPAYLRLAGPSTKYLVFLENRKNASNTESSLTITPSTWSHFNSWLSRRNLTLVFALNDYDRIQGNWDPKSILFLFNLTDKLSIPCHFQLGYDCLNKTINQYKDDLVTLRHVLDAFPNSKLRWDIIGSNLEKLQLLSIEDRRIILEELKSVTRAVMWEPYGSIEFPLKDNARQRTRDRKETAPIWLATTKENNPTTFYSALEWANQLGIAALEGYEVIFRQPRLFEIISATPTFWATAFHKLLVGQTVLDVKTSGLHTNVNVFAHCTQNNYANTGSITFLVVNKGDRPVKIGIKLPGNLKNAEILSYFLTSTEDNSTLVFCNDKELILNEIETPEKMCLPLLRKLQNTKHLSIISQAKSIGFIVLPSARLSICMRNESEQNLQSTQNILNKIEEQPKNLQEVYESLKNEINLDKSFYDRMNEINLSKPKMQSRNNLNKDGNYLLSPSAMLFIEKMHQDEKERLNNRRLSIRQILRKAELDYKNKYGNGKRKRRSLLEKYQQPKYRSIALEKSAAFDKLRKLKEEHKERTAELMERMKQKRLFRKQRAINMSMVEDKPKKLAKSRQNEYEELSKEEEEKGPATEIKKIYEDIAKFVENSRKQISELNKQNWGLFYNNKNKEKDSKKGLIVSPTKEDATVEDVSQEEVQYEARQAKNTKENKKNKLKKPQSEVVSRTNPYKDMDTLLADDLPTYSVGKDEDIAKSIKNLEEYFKNAQRLDMINQQSLDDNYGIFDSIEQGSHFLRYKRDKPTFDAVDGAIKEFFEMLQKDSLTESEPNFQYMLLGQSLDPNFFANLNRKIINNNLETENNENGLDNDHLDVLKEIEFTHVNDGDNKFSIPLDRKKREFCELIGDNKIVKKARKIKKRTKRNIYDNSVRSEENESENMIQKEFKTPKNSKFADKDSVSKKIHEIDNSKENTIQKLGEKIENVKKTQKLNKKIDNDYKIQKINKETDNDKTVKSSIGKLVSKTNNKRFENTIKKLSENSNKNIKVSNNKILKNDKNEQLTTETTTEFDMSTLLTNTVEDSSYTQTETVYNDELTTNMPNINVKIKDHGFFQDVLDYINGTFNTLKTKISKYFNV